MDWQFRAASATAFAADLNALCGAFGYAPLAPLDGAPLGSVEFQALLRFDFDAFVLPSGWHVNARASTLPHVDGDKTAAALALLDTQIRGFFAGLPTITNPDPAGYLGAGGQVWHVTPTGTVFIDPRPILPARVWA